MNADELARRLAHHRPRLLGFVRSHAGATLRSETADDLVQDIHLKAVSRADEFVFRSEPEFEAWVLRVARGHLADRHDYWTAAKRRPERLLRLTRAEGHGSDPAAVREPARDTAGPATRAGRADELARAEKALGLLLPRDADLVRGAADGRTLDEEAERLGITYASAQKARHRALERYRRAFEVLDLRA